MLLSETLTFSMVVQACLSGVVKQSGSGPPSRQMFDSISIRTESPKPRGLVAWSEKYLERKWWEEWTTEAPHKEFNQNPNAVQVEGNLKKLLNNLYLKMRLKCRLGLTAESQSRGLQFWFVEYLIWLLSVLRWPIGRGGASSASSLWVNLTSLILDNWC